MANIFHGEPFNVRDVNDSNLDPHTPQFSTLGSTLDSLQISVQSQPTFDGSE